MIISPSPEAIENLIVKFEGLSEKVQSLTNGYCANKLQNRRVDNLKNVADEKTTEWKRIIPPLIVELDLDFTPYRRYFASEGFVALAELDFNQVAIVLFPIYCPEFFKGRLAHCEVESIIGPIVHDCKRLHRILENRIPLAAKLAESTPASNEASAKDDLTDTERNILKALAGDTLTGAELLKRAGYDNSSHYRTILSNLCKRDILGNDGKGYFKK